MISKEQIDFFHTNGYVHIQNVFPAEETKSLQDELDFILDNWAVTNMGWNGPWREAVMDPETDKASKLVHLHNLETYSRAFQQAITGDNVTNIMRGLLGEIVEFHHSTLHIKPPSTGHPFPLHQDMAFYEHEDDRFVDMLIHLDDTRHENGEIRFIDGSHKNGYLEHVRRYDNGDGCTPHLRVSEHPIEATTAVPAKAGDVVCFNINTIHGSYINQTNVMRRLVRVGYRHPENHQLTGQARDTPGLMISGLRPKNAMPGELKRDEELVEDPNAFVL